MPTKTMKLTESELQHYNKLRISIEKWSVEYARLQLQTDRVKGALATMYESNMQLMNASFKAANIDPSQVLQAVVSDNGDIEVHLTDTQLVSSDMDPTAPAAVTPAAEAANPS